MNPPRSLLLVMAPLVGSLTLLVLVPATAAPAKKTPPPLAAPAVVETPAPKRSILQKLNPFHKKAPPPAPAPPPVPARNSKKSKVPPATPAAPLIQPAAPAIPLGSVSPNPPAAQEPDEPKQGGFFSRLKAKFNHDEEVAVVAEKPERPADWKDRWVVTEDSTAFFEYGPSQASGPDLRLSRGQVVKLSHTTRGWARVELDGGRQGYIGSDQMRQAAQTDFADPVLPPTQLAAIGAGLQGWSPAPPPPDLPDLPMAPGSEDALLLLPPLEFEGTELKKSSLKLKPLPTEAPTLQPGDSLPPASLEPPVLESGKENPPALPSIPAPTEPVPPAPPVPTEAPAPGPAQPTLPS
ncbi:MAG: SH3 domain-containing protein [Verrucomicrobiota bacterium]